MREKLLVCWVAVGIIGCGGGGSSGSGGSSGGGTGQVNTVQVNAVCANAKAVVGSGGALTAAQEQQVQAYSAQLTQDAANRGGVGVNQIPAQVASYRQSLVQQNFNAAVATINQSC